MKSICRCVPCLLCLFAAVELRADVIIQMTTIGNAGNADDLAWEGNPDTTVDDIWLGGVDYDYQISTYEVTVAQYTEFLNAVAASDPNGLWSSSMGDGGGIGIPIITRSGEDGSYTYTAASGTENEPVRYVSFYDATRFCNWLANGQGSGSTETGSYTLADGYSLARTTSATWIIPSEDEWYKAAYYDPVNDTYYDYPNGSDDVPSEPADSTTTREMNFGDDPYWNPDGGLREYFTQIGETTGCSAYGVYDMGGNVEEWTDSFTAPNYRIARGGGLFEPETSLRTTHQQPRDPTAEGDGIGFRVAYLIPEPSSVVLMFLGSLGCALGWLRRKLP